MPARQMIANETAKADWNKAVAAKQNRDGGAGNAEGENRIPRSVRRRISRSAAFQVEG